MNKLLCNLVLALAFIQTNAQSLYMKDFGSSYSSWGFYTNYSGGVTDNGGTSVRSCSYTNGDDYTGMGTYAQYTRSNLYDPLAQNYAYVWDSVVFKFRYRTEGYARNFRIIFDYLVGAGSTYEYDVQRNYFQADTEDVKIVAFGPTGNALNCGIGLIKTDTTLNNFTVYLSDLSIKGYISYNATGLKEENVSKSPILYTNETLFFPDSWLQKIYWITDILGKEYLSGVVNTGQEKIQLENGLYILRTETLVQKIYINH